MRRFRTHFLFARFLGVCGLWCQILAIWHASAAITLTGVLYFGERQTTFTDLANDPIAEGIPDPTAGDGFLASTLVVLNQSGRLVGVDGLSFGDGTALRVQILPNGDARYVGTESIFLTGSRNGGVHLESVRLNYARLELTAAGLSAFDSVVRLPAGAGFALSADTRRYRSLWPLGRLFLDQSLRPLTSIRLGAGDLGAPELWLCVDGYPLLLRTSALLWDPGSGSFQSSGGVWEFARKGPHAALDALQAEKLNGSSIQGDTSRLSNDGLFGNPGPAGEVVLRADRKGVARLEGNVPLGPTSYLSHFPGARLKVSGGVIAIRNGEIDPKSSTVALAESVLQFYEPDCAEPGCGASQSAPSPLAFGSEGTSMRVTVDAGLVGGGAVDPITLAWGNAGPGMPTHRAGPFSRATLMIAGTRLSGADLSPSVDGRPGDLLFSGFSESGERDEAERPYSEGYARGFAEYPGLNVRVDGNQTGQSQLGGSLTDPYVLAGRGKYYARFAGVSGIHQAANFVRPIPLRGFWTKLESLGLAFLDNENVASRTAGSVRVPGPSDAPKGPSGFDLPFRRLEFGCVGDPGPAQLASGDTLKQMSYWMTSFEPLSVAFENAIPYAPCGPAAKSFLVVGARVPLPLLTRPVVGTLAFSPSGDLATAAEGSRFDSRLRLPAEMVFSGPGDSRYRITGLRHAYLNRWSDPERPAEGFVNFFGALDVPFFKDMKIHAQMHPGLGALGLALMGGWRAESGAVPAAGEAWMEGSESPFTKQTFDAAHRGFPPGISFEGYRDSGTAAFNPRVEQDWMGILHFDERLQWRPAELRFRDDQRLPSRSERALLFQLERRVKTLSAAGAEVTFGATPSLPRFSPNELVRDAVDRTTGLSRAMEQTLNEVTGVIRDRTGIARAADRLDRLTSIHPDSFLRPTMHGALRPLARGLLGVLRPAYESAVDSAAAAGADAVGQAEAARLRVCHLFDAGDGAFTPVFRNFTQGTELVKGVAGGVDGALADVEDGLQEVLDVLKARTVPGAIPPRTERRVLVELARRLATPERLGPYGAALGSEYAGNLVDTMQREYLPEAEQAFQDLEQQVAGALEQVRAFHAQFRAVSGPAIASLDGFYSEASEVQGWFGSISNAVCSTFAAPSSAPGVWFRELSVAQAEDRLLVAIEDEFLRRLFAERTTLLLRTAFSPTRGVFQGALDELFAQLNDMVRRSVDEQLLRLGLPLTDAEVTRFLDRLDRVAQGTRVRGHARINEDSLEELRLDGHFSFGLYGVTPGGSQERLEFDAWCEVHQYRSDSPAEGCRPIGTASATAELGARFSPGGGFVSGMKVGLKARAGFRDGELLGIGGGILLSGSKRIAGASVTDPSLGFHFGMEGNYVGGLASVAVRDFAGGGTLFVGEACQLAQLTFADPDLGLVLQRHGVDPTRRIAGFWVRADGAFPLERLLPVPPLGCLLHLEGRGGIGYYLLVVNDAPFTATAGVLARKGLSGQIYCALTGTGELTLVGGATLSEILSGSGPYVYGHGFIEGKVLGVKRRKDFDFNARLIRQGSSFDAEFHIPFLE